MSEVETIETIAGAIRLKRSDRRTLAISVLPNGAIELVAPRDTPLGDIATKVAKRIRWIVAQRRAFADMNHARLPLRYVSGATHRYLGRQYRLKLERGESGGVRLMAGYFHVSGRTGNPEEVAALLGKWLRDRAQAQFSERLRKWNGWCRDRGLPTPSLRLLRMPKRWGSAHPNGRIYLSPELVKAPPVCIDYVIAHEVCHLLHPTHDSKFYRQLSELIPDWKQIKARLESVDL